MDDTKDTKDIKKRARLRPFSRADEQMIARWVQCVVESII